ncbi:beta-amylase 4 [Artemisia annua]|uniref:Beta-amylase n=1 Tax=Artemisia annua TaxID=35608 RepID=A0A2U1LWZ0_ARTAN|nr:beta-amylase 4 [Artemisia annua]
MDVREKSRSTLFESSKHKRVPIYVMMPIDSFGIDTSGAPRIRKIKALTISLKALKLAGVHGIAVEIGRQNKDIYYRDQNGFPNGDYLTLGVDNIPLFSGRTGLQCYEDFISSFANKFDSLMGTIIEEVCVGLGPSGELRHPAHPFQDGRWQFPGVGAFQCYDKYMMEDLRTVAWQEGKPDWANKGPPIAGDYNSFPTDVPFFEEEKGSFSSDYGQFFSAHPFQDGRWQFPGVGAFQCYDKYMMEDLRTVAWQEGKPDWANKGPPIAGDYNSFPTDVPFFEEGEGSFSSDYGQFFLEWYSDRLLGHADAILGVAASLLRKYQEDEQSSVRVVAKIGLLYWWYQTLSHPAELTAGYYNTAFRDGYDPLTSMLSRHGAALQISCFEMLDNETPQTYLCSPEGLLRQIFKTPWF